MDFEEWTSSDDVVLSRRDALSLSPAEGVGDDLFEAQLADEDDEDLQVQVDLEDATVSDFDTDLADEVAPVAAVSAQPVEAEPELAARTEPEAVTASSPEPAVVALEQETVAELELTPHSTAVPESDLPETDVAAQSAAIVESALELEAAKEGVDLSGELAAKPLSETTSSGAPADVDTVDSAAEAAEALEAAEAAQAAKAAKAAAKAAKAAAKAVKAAAWAEKEAAKAAEAAEAAKAENAVEATKDDPSAGAVDITDETDEGPATDGSPAQPFAGAPAGVRAALERRGFEGMSLVQEAVLAAEAGGRDLQISSQTGSGKTIALGFVLARTLEGSREPGPLALVIVPTRELANQVCEELGWLFADLDGVQVGSVVGGNPVWRDRQLLSRRPRVLVGTPGRLLDHVSSRTLDLSNVRELVLDEADQMLDMGFREELEGILDATPKERRTHMVSATFPTGIQRLAERYQREPLAIQGTQLGHANADIEHRGHLIHQRDRFGVLVNLLLEAGDVRTLIFVERRADTVEVAEKLESEGFAALPLSGELAQSQRERTLAAFRSGRASVLVATDVAARGLDVPDVRLVIHTAPPLDAETYTHRSGRTGRAGQTGSSVLLAAPSRRRRVAGLMSEAGIDFKWRPAPTAANVRALVAERHRDALATELAAALEAGASVERVDEAKALLAEHEPTALVAALLTKLEPAQRAEPREVEVLNAREDRGYDGGPRERPSYGDRGRGNDRHDRPWEGRQNGGRQDSGERYGSRERFGQRDRGDRGQRRGPDAPGEFVRFFINWGENQGASPGRVLATVCRRGDVSGGEVGSIAVHPNASTFDVHSSVAERFEDLASRRDRRDPKTMIRRDRGPRPSGARGGR